MLGRALHIVALVAAVGVIRWCAPQLVGARSSAHPRQSPDGQVFDDVDAPRREPWPQSLERCQLVCKCMRGVVDDELELRRKKQSTQLVGGGGGEGSVVNAGHSAGCSNGRSGYGATAATCVWFEESTPKRACTRGSFHTFASS